MQEVQVSTHGGWQVATARGASGGFVAWAKMGLIQSDCPIKEPGQHVWINFGATRDEARNRVLAEVGLTPNDAIAGLSGSGA